MGNKKISRYIPSLSFLKVPKLTLLTYKELEFFIKEASTGFKSFNLDRQSENGTNFILVFTPNEIEKFHSIIRRFISSSYTIRMEGGESPLFEISYSKNIYNPSELHIILASIQECAIIDNRINVRFFTNKIGY
jgi:hypothetical protein